MVIICVGYMFYMGWGARRSTFQYGDVVRFEGVNICAVFKNSVYMFCMGWGIEEVCLNMGMCEDFKVANICVVFFKE